MDNATNLVIGSSLGAELSQKEAATLAGLMSHNELADNEYLIKEGATDDSLHVLLSGKLEVVSGVADLDMESLRDGSGSVRVRVRANDPTPEEARPGMSADVRIHCGERAVGYVWLHDVWETVYRWWTF